MSDVEEGGMRGPRARTEDAVAKRGRVARGDRTPGIIGRAVTWDAPHHHPGSGSRIVAEIGEVGAVSDDLARMLVVQPDGVVRIVRADRVRVVPPAEEASLSANFRRRHHRREDERA